MAERRRQGPPSPLRAASRTVVSPGVPPGFLGFRETRRSRHRVVQNLFFFLLCRRRRRRSLGAQHRGIVELSQSVFRCVTVFACYSSSSSRCATVEARPARWGQTNPPYNPGVEGCPAGEPRGSPRGCHHSTCSPTGAHPRRCKGARARGPRAPRPRPSTDPKEERPSSRTRGPEDPQCDKSDTRLVRQIWTLCRLGLATPHHDELQPLCACRPGPKNRFGAKNQ